MAEINYDITIDDQNQYVVELNEQGPQGANGEDGNGIVNITKTSTSGLIDTYTINYTNGGSDTFTVNNGNGIQSISKTSTSGLNDTYTIEFTNGTNTTFVVTNGSNISTIAKTATVGLVDTYTVTLTNGNTTTFNVTNGYSPTANVVKEGGEATITISDKSGTTTAKVYDGTVPSEAIKGYLDAGEPLTDAKGLEEVTNYSHSTFDISKFTLEGTPSITNDGIASGFSESNLISFSVSTGNIFTLKQKIKTGSNISNAQIFAYAYRATNTSDRLFDLRFNNGSFFIVYKNNTGTNTALDVSKQVSANTEYVIELVINNGSIALFIDGNSFYSADNLYVDGISKIETAPSGSVAYFKGSIDLKQFSITVDSVEVFSGNKTGIDIVKPNDYTKVGSPTISADGIASGFGGSSYITSISSLDLTKPYDFYIDCHTPSSWHNNYEAVTGSTSIAIRNYNGKWGIDLGALSITSVNAISLDTDYSLRINYDGNSTYKFYANGVLEGTTTGTPARTSGILTIGYYNTNDTGRYWGGTIDLNSIKFYSNGGLAYQSCLKIPYTQSKTGSKIVDSHYRNRVTDMYNQFGYSPYYTLSNIDYTLPCGELYGLYNRMGASSAMPSMKYTDLTLAATNTPYTAPSDGYFYLDKTTTASGQVVILALIDTAGNVVMQSYCMSSDTGQKLRTYLPVYRGSVVVPIYTAAGATNAFRFIYAQGSEVEK